MIIRDFISQNHQLYFDNLRLALEVFIFYAFLHCYSYFACFYSEAVLNVSDLIHWTQNKEYKRAFLSSDAS